MEIIEIAEDEFNESDHPRDSDGKFSSGSSPNPSGTRFSRSDMPEVKSGNIRLYHGSNGSNIKEISSESFGGLFASPDEEAAESHGDNMHFMDVPESEIASNDSLEEHYNSEAVNDLVDRWASSDSSDEAKEKIKDAAIYDESLFDMDEDDAEEIRESLGAEDIGSANWEIQTLRGQMAERLGFKAVEMNDEHGTSYLVLPDNKVFGMDSIAMDKSARSYDQNGHLLVDKTIITKAAVNPYRGSSIPQWQSLGLNPDQDYMMLRDPDELRLALDTFKGLQLLKQHIPVDAEKPEKESTIGSIGTDVTMDDDGRVWSSLRVFDQEGIDYIESRTLGELSAGYSYTADMTQGTFNGIDYDGIMRNIHGNHVAIVERGRIGSDAIIADSIEGQLMAKKIKLKDGSLAKLHKQLGMDSMEETKKAIIAIHGSLALDADDDKKAEDEDEEEKKAEDEDDDTDIVEDEDDQTEADKDNESEAMRLKEREKREAKDREKDKKEIAQDALDTFKSISTALREVEPLVGILAMDGFNSGHEVYEYALKQSGKKTEGINTEGLRAICKITSEKPRVAMDSFQKTGKLSATTTKALKGLK